MHAGRPRPRGRAAGTDRRHGKYLLREALAGDALPSAPSIALIFPDQLKLFMQGWKVSSI